jgi:hypothetical protein
MTAFHRIELIQEPDCNVETEIDPFASADQAESCVAGAAG